MSEYGYKFLWVKHKMNLIQFPDYLALVKLAIPNGSTIVCPVGAKSVITDISARFEPFYLVTSSSIKCRCSKAKIVEVIDYFYYGRSSEFSPNTLFKVKNYNGNPKDLIFLSLYNSDFQYSFNKYVIPDGLDIDTNTECSHGIHFCRSVEDAKAYIKDCTLADIYPIELDYFKLPPL